MIFAILLCKNIIVVLLRNLLSVRTSGARKPHQNGMALSCFSLDADVYKRTLRPPSFELCICVPVKSPEGGEGWSLEHWNPPICLEWSLLLNLVILLFAYFCLF